jgi:hypothetical protein
VLAVGNYRLTLISDQGANRGIVGFFHNNNLIGNVNCYAASQLLNVSFFLNFRVQIPGIQVLRTRVTGKESASTGFLFRCAVILIDSIP